MRRIILSSAIALALSVSGVAWAASDGTLGTTSTGSSDHTLIKGESVLITKVNDVDWGQYAAGFTSTGATVTMTDEVCVFSTAGGGDYTVTLQDGNWSGTQFELLSGADAIPFTVDWEDAAGASEVNMGEGAAYGPSGGFHGHQTEQDCGNATATNATITYQVTEDNIAAAPVGVYTATLQLLITPN